MKKLFLLLILPVFCFGQNDADTLTGLNELIPGPGTILTSNPDSSITVWRNGATKTFKNTPKFEPISGTNITISGSYPNLTIHDSGRYDLFIKYDTTIFELKGDSLVFKINPRLKLFRDETPIWLFIIGCCIGFLLWIVVRINTQKYRAIILLILPFPIKTLTWSDFKGQFIPKNGEIASINTGLSWEYEQADTIVYNVRVRSEFRSDLSYSGTRDTYILNHEQQHANICLLYSRKANSLFKLQYLFSEKDFMQLKSKIEAEWNTTDSLYDAETDHSRNKPEQIRWNRLIKEQLKQTK